MIGRYAFMAMAAALPLMAQPQLALVSPVTQVKVWPAGQPAVAVDVWLSGSAGQNIAAIQFTLTLPPGTSVAATAGSASAAAQKTATCGPPTPGTNSVTCVVEGLNTNAYADGDVADLNLTFAPNGTMPVSYAVVPSGALAASLAGAAVVTGSGSVAAIPVANPCDITGDGKVDIADVQAQVQQAIGAAPCTTGDLVGQGKCDIVSTERVIDAALGQGCRVGQ